MSRTIKMKHVEDEEQQNPQASRKKKLFSEKKHKNRKSEIITNQTKNKKSYKVDAEEIDDVNRSNKSVVLPRFKTSKSFK